MTRNIALLAAASLVTSVWSATASSQPAPEAPAPSPVPAAAGEQLHALFRASDEANLRRNPLAGMFRGDYRYADRLGDLLTDAYYAAEKAAAEQELAAFSAA